MNDDHPTLEHVAEVKLKKTDVDLLKEQHKPKMDIHPQILKSEEKLTTKEIKIPKRKKTEQEVKPANKTEEAGKLKKVSIDLTEEIAKKKEKLEKEKKEKENKTKPVIKDKVEKQASSPTVKNDTKPVKHEIKKYPPYIAPEFENKTASVKTEIPVHTESDQSWLPDWEWEEVKYYGIIAS